jgi:hypothetical protein
LIVGELHLKLCVQAGRRHSRPFRLVLRPQGRVLALFVLEEPLHLTDHLHVVLPNGTDT